MNKNVLLFVLFSISATVFFAWTKLNQAPPSFTQEEKNRALEQMLGRKIKEKKIVPQGELTFEGKLFSLSYPAYAKLYDRDNASITKNKNLLEYLRLDSEEPKFRFVVLVQSEDNNTVLEEFSGVRTRKLNKFYKEKPLTIDGNDGVLFAKESGGVERSSFLLINGRSFSFSITGVDAGELEGIYKKIMESVKF